MVLGFSAIDFVSLSFLRVRSQSRTSFPFRCVFTLWRKLRGARTASVKSGPKPKIPPLSGTSAWSNLPSAALSPLNGANGCS
ncbi:hypothetical protein LR48_Vigan98s000100 [Vigna angularis]|uniref:Uncharacterized protein n=1 Tax=Phaseolus angularis TaxID=3914 RepID=A0A0L9T5F0_PHAAN|nr:hypothetical protein LR48_Vigan98s000100 [Vigna angularis]